MELIEYMEEYDDGDEFVVGSFNITENLHKLKKNWKNRRRNLDDLEYIRQQPIIDSSILGGKIFLVNPYDLSSGVLSNIDTNTPMGLTYVGDQLYVANDKSLSNISQGKHIQTISHRLFNCLHGLSLTLSGDGMIVVSTGIDGFLHIDIKDPQNIRYMWLGTENGFDTNRFGEKRFIDVSKDYSSQDFHTYEHTTHINSCINHSYGKYLATLFHQGVVVEIDSYERTTKVVYSGLTNPHGIRMVDGGYMVSDTNGKRVVFLDREFNFKKSFEGNYNWIQDACPLADGSFLIGDSNNHRLVRVDERGNQIGIMRYSDSFRIGCLITASKQQVLNTFNS